MLLSIYCAHTMYNVELVNSRYLWGTPHLQLGNELSSYLNKQNQSMMDEVSYLYTLKDKMSYRTKAD